MSTSQVLIAQRIVNPVLGTLASLTSIEFIQGLIRALVTMGFIIGTIIFVFYFIIGAVEWIASGGDKVRVQSARDRITTALVGLFVLLALFAIVNLISLFFGIDLTTFDIDYLRVY